MLLKFSVENFMSIREEQIIEFTITKKDKLNNASEEICGKYINNIACVLGANGSGKSNILKALTFVAELMFDSYKKPDNFYYKKFKLDESKNTKFNLEFISNDNIYTYSIVLDNEKILEETLDVKKQRKNNIFSLKRYENDTNIKANFTINNIDSKRLLEELKNVSALSFFIGTGYLKDIKDIFGYCIIHEQSLPMFAKMDIAVKQLHLYSENSKELFNLVKDTIENSVNFGFSEMFFQDIIGIHGENKKMLYFKHINKNNETFILPLNEESLGTQEVVFLSLIIARTISEGKMTIIDEIENRIHPFLIEKLISLFADKTINKNHAQIIFSTHQPYLLKELTKTQIFFAEKEDLETEIYRLDEVDGVRNDDNFYMKYLNGIYGGVPEVK